MVLVHGGLGMDSSYLRALEPLATRNRLIAYDQRGHGQSPTADLTGLTIADLVADLDEVLDDVGEPAVVFGHSYGGFVTLQHAVAGRHRARGYVIVGSSARQPNWAEIEQRLSTRDVPVEALAALASDPPDDAAMGEMLNAMAPLYVHRVDPAVLREQLAGTRFCRDGLRAGNEAVDGWSVADGLPSVDAPMLVMGGAHDWIFSVDELRAIADAVPGAELAVFDDSGHFPWIEEPEEFFSALEDWLAKLP